MKSKSARGVSIAAAFVLAWVVGVAPASAQDPEEVLRLRELVVSATRAETEVRDVPVNVTVITREELTLSAAQNLEDVLLEIPGVGLQRNVRSASAHPSWQAVSLRGLGGNAASRTLVMVDGVPLNDGYFGWVRWDQVPVETIERIEIVRGGGSTAWGGQSLAGVIQVITRDPDEGGLSAAAEAGTQSTFRGDGMVTFGGGRVGGFVAAEFLDTDGYVLTTPDQRGSVDIPSASDHFSLRGKLTFDASETVQILASGSYYDEDKTNATPIRQNTTQTGFGQIGLRAGRPEGSLFAVNLFGQGQDYANTFSTVSSDRNSEVPSISQFDVPSETFGANAQWSHASLGAHSISLGVDLTSIHGEAFEDVRWEDGAFLTRRHTGGDQFLTGLFAQDRIGLSDRVDLTAGARLDIWNNSNGFRQVSDIASGDIASDTEFEDRDLTRFSANTGLRVLASDRVSFRGSVYSGLRIPTLNELYKPFRAAGGVVTESNALLEPERLIGFEVGVDYELGRQWLARATGFYNRVNDAILDATIMEVEESGVVDPCGFVPAGGVCRQRMNVGSIRAIGLETQIEYRPTAAWLVAASFDYAPSEIIAAEGREEIVGNRPPRTAKAQGTLRVGHVDVSKLEALVIGRYIGTQFENDVNTQQIDDSFVVDLRLARQVTRTLLAYATIQNVFDTEWQISNEATLTRVGTPRAFVGGLRIRVSGAAR
ncbi:MAG: TonB-dependent receptor [Gemmatimonadota bacterium]|nr:TonB-dependent receptor [Gemmatimonadota bacterium]